jgi:hypothetical protein
MRSPEAEGPSAFPDVVPRRLFFLTLRATGTTINLSSIAFSISRPFLPSKRAVATFKHRCDVLQLDIRSEGAPNPVFTHYRLFTSRVTQGGDH